MVYLALLVYLCVKYNLGGVSNIICNVGLPRPEKALLAQLASPMGYYADVQGVSFFFRSIEKFFLQQHNTQ